MRKTTAILPLLVLLIATGASGADQAGLTVVVEGLKSSSGTVAIALYDSEGAYDAREGAVRSAFVEIEGGSCVWTVEGLPPGEYAAMLYHDRNGNGELDARKVGPPKEPYGFSNDARAPFGPPAFESARFTLDRGKTEIRVRVH
jgi:uncharacterized protein (DUF2141 family)